MRKNKKKTVELESEENISLSPVSKEKRRGDGAHGARDVPEEWSHWDLLRRVLANLQIEKDFSFRTHISTTTNPGAFKA